jgi:thiamine biosynthesis lipoprotein ApbE
MATRFEIVLHGENPLALRAAGEDALNEIDRLEARLSLYRSTSEIAHVNARAGREPVRVSPEVFALLQRAHSLSAETGGAFDITIAPLVRCWGFMNGSGNVPNDDALAQARANVGMSLVHLNPQEFTVQFTREGVMLDLGAIGKGYAVEQAAEILRDAGITSALVHGGTSTVYAIGCPPEADCWKVAVEKPDCAMSFQPTHEPQTVRMSNGTLTPSLSPSEGERVPKAGEGAVQRFDARNASGKSLSEERANADNPSPGTKAARASVTVRQGASPLIATVPLKDEALSVSAVWGKSFEVAGKSFGHVLDPRTGQPATNALLAAVALASATETDAFSTALLILGSEGHEKISALRSGTRTLLVVATNETFHTEAKGLALDFDKII